MTKRRAWIAAFLSVTALALAGELYAAFDSSSNTTPWTELITRYVPWPVTAAAIAVLITWLPWHFYLNYRARKAVPMTQPAPAPDPNTSSTEPLVSVGTITAVATAVITALVTFGLHLSPDQLAATLGVISVLAPLVVAVWGRRKVYAPATVARLLAAKRAGT